MPSAKRFRNIYLIFWILLVYTLAALIWWFVALNNQNHAMAKFKLSEAGANKEEILLTEKRKTTQFIGEGIIFFLMIGAGAVYVFFSLRARLRQTQQQEEFMMAITHELKTPIAVASLNLETMQKRKLDEQKQQHIIQATLEETKRLDDLCNNLLVSSRIEAGGYKLLKDDVNIKDLVNGIVNQFRRRFPDRQFIYEGPAADRYVNGDDILLQMAINNLLDNAIKYSPKEQPVEVTLTNDNGNITLAVADKGKGIAEAEMNKVFAKFYRSSGERVKGTGLGLYLAKRITAMHNGNIFVTNNKPTGSIFTIQLPANG